MELINKLADERRARLAAERKLELKQAELHAANRKLAKHARSLSQEINEKRAEMETVLDENFRVKSDLTIANKRVQIAERRLWDSIETIQDGFAVFDAEDRLVIANRAYLVVFDGLEEVAPGVSYTRILELLTEEGIIDTEGVSGPEWQDMMAQRWRDGARAPLVIRTWNDQYIKLIDARTGDGETVSLALNITGSVRYAKELELAQSRAEQASRAKSAFLANMSHEIRTPMNGVMGMADLLCDSNLNDEQQLYVDTIRNSSEALLVIINDVLDFSKIEAEKMVLHPAPFDLERCVHEVLMLLNPACREKQLVLQLDYDLFLPTQFIGDQGRIRQVLTNFVGNAVKFTLKGTVTVRVTGIPAADGSDFEVHVAVEDTGIGIPENMVGHIFGEFNQVEDTRNRKFEGTGLGLAISQRLVRLMEGQVWVDSTEGVGSTFGFKITLPASEPVSAPPQRLPAHMQTALVVDTQAGNREIMAKQLRQLGLQVDVCDAAFSAMDHVDKGYSVIVTAHVMNGMDGLELAEAAAERGVKSPVILQTSNAAAISRDPAARHLCSVLQHPVSRSSLFLALHEAAAAMPAGSVRAIEAPLDGAHAHPPTPARPVRILAAEDNKTNRLVFKKMIKSLNAKVEFAENGLEALSLYDSFCPDIIFMDISMPEMDGKEATIHIRDLERAGGPRIPIVAMTAHALDGDDSELLAAGMDHYMTKPLRKQEIIDVIEKFKPDCALPLLPDAAETG